MLLAAFLGQPELPELGILPLTSAFGDPSQLLAWLHHFGGGYGVLCSPSLAQRTWGDH